MKKISGVIVIGLLCFLMSVQVQAQTKSKRIGLGVSLGKEMFADEGLSLTMLDFPSLYVPIVSPTFRFEPEIGFIQFSNSDDYSEYTYNLLLLGVGIFKQTQKGQTNLYYGLRAGMSWSSYHYEYEDDWYYGDDEDTESKTDFYFGPAVGGEYCFTEHLSLGGEIQFNVILFGSYDEDDDESVTLLKTKPLIFVRWYF